MDKDAKPLRIALVAGEASGDLLGAALITALRHYFPDAIFYGVAGPKMQAAGCETLFESHQLAVMGFVDVLAKLPSLLRVRRLLTRILLTDPPDLFIGIDAPDFNLPLEVKLKRGGIRVVHYVSPTIWAWRKGRIHQVAKGCDLMLTLFPFEAELYQARGISAICVGHPLGEQLHPLNKADVRHALAIPSQAPVVAMLPGSRHGELRYIAKPMLLAAKRLAQVFPQMCFVVPMINASLAQAFSHYVKNIAPELTLKVSLDDSELILASADCAMVKSGTSTLQAMLLQVPQVVVFKMNRLNALILRCLVRTRFIAFPNILAGRAIVPELLQSKATPANIDLAMTTLLTDAQAREAQQSAYQQASAGLRAPASDIAAQAIVTLLQETSSALAVGAACGRPE